MLDLYAGSGAIGLDGLVPGCGVGPPRRGGSPVPPPDRGQRRRPGLRGRQGHPGPRVDRARRPTPGDPVDVAYLDPPYDLPDADVVADLESLAAHGWLADGAVVVVERSARSAPVAWPSGYRAERDRRYGETALWWALWYGPTSPSTGTDAREE
ncbi:MAG: RsmD family RNA methyltransferase [Nocardioides sp.]